MWPSINATNAQTIFALYLPRGNALIFRLTILDCR